MEISSPTFPLIFHDPDKFGGVKSSINKDNHKKGSRVKLDGSCWMNKYSGETKTERFTLNAIIVKKRNFIDAFIVYKQYLSKDEHAITEVCISYETDA